jgi:hypothetical protein
MSDYPFIGARGETYVYEQIDPTGALPLEPGCYIFARMGVGGVTPVCIGETDSLPHLLLEGAWIAAQREHGADQMYFHVRLNSPARRAELEDLMDFYHPKMTARDMGNEDQG